MQATNYYYFFFFYQRWFSPQLYSVQFILFKPQRTESKWTQVTPLLIRQQNFKSRTQRRLHCCLCAGHSLHEFSHARVFNIDQKEYYATEASSGMQRHTLSHIPHMIKAKQSISNLTTCTRRAGKEHVSQQCNTEQTGFVHT